LWSWQWVNLACSHWVHHSKAVLAGGQAPHWIQITKSALTYLGNGYLDAWMLYRQGEEHFHHWHIFVVDAAE
jgi:hypothetical protein